MNVLSAEMAPEMEALKTRLKATWMSGDYGHFATYLEAGALDFLSRIRIEPGTRILDVACGAGQTAIPMARAGAKVTGVDIATYCHQPDRAGTRPCPAGKPGCPFRGRGRRDAPLS
jgi:2-polyprenyl-3-methyl-5-hydroxy-6-metoxy-1,4-benzoquinol methylase